MIISITILFILAILIGLSEAIEELTGDENIWKTTVFARKEPTSFWGPRQHTWRRKDHPNKLINYLRHTVLVGTTDIWHASDVITHAITFIGIPLVVLLTTPPIWALLATWVVFMMAFHLGYHKIFIKNA